MSQKGGSCQSLEKDGKVFVLVSGNTTASSTSTSSRIATGSRKRIKSHSKGGTRCLGSKSGKYKNGDYVERESNTVM